MSSAGSYEQTAFKPHVPGNLAGSRNVPHECIHCHITKPSGAPAFPICSGCKLVRYCVSNLFQSWFLGYVSSRPTEPRASDCSLERSQTVLQVSEAFQWEHLGKRACLLRDGSVRPHGERGDDIPAGRLLSTAYVDSVCRDGVLHSRNSVSVRCEEEVHAHRPAISPRRRWEPRENVHC